MGFWGSGSSVTHALPYTNIWRQQNQKTAHWRTSFLNDCTHPIILFPCAKSKQANKGAGTGECDSGGACWEKVWNNLTMRNPTHFYSGIAEMSRLVGDLPEDLERARCSSLIKLTFWNVCREPPLERLVIKWPGMQREVGDSLCFRDVFSFNKIRVRVFTVMSQSKFYLVKDDMTRYPEKYRVSSFWFIHEAQVKELKEFNKLWSVFVCSLQCS